MRPTPRQMSMNDSEARALELYTRAVQSPEREVELLASRFQRRRGREALTLREDFSGAGATSVAWVESHDDREAMAVDRDARVLAFGRAKAETLDEGESSRLSFVARDVSERSERAFDLISAMNFSWAMLDEASLRTYLTAAADSLEDDGLLALEFFGGPRLRVPHVSVHHLDGFTYRFEVKSFAAPFIDVALHFEERGRIYEDAFTYRFCLRSKEALDTMLAEAGLRNITWLYEDRSGRHVARRGRPRRPLWAAVVLSEPAR
ncbi:MAG: hypothetical protein AB8I08_08400 [Sandaracinaceae bacterium]